MTVLYGITIFTSAVLLFSIQPMVGKMILPTLGGSPAVWNTCMVFFQAALLAGYWYAHKSVTGLGVRRQAGVHVMVLLLPLLVLPIDIDSATGPPGDSNPALWLLVRLTMAVGLPFLVVSASAPLLQRWFSATGHRLAGDPYFLYAASNMGSLLALLGYPTFFERTFDLSDQTRIWMVGYLVLVVLIFACAVVVRRSARSTDVETDQPSDDEAGSPRPSLRDRAKWVALAFVPSSLMLGVTTHITTDVAAVPLFWVVPLAIYLLTFVIAFARRTVVPAGWSSRLLPFLLIPVAALIYAELKSSILIAMSLHLLAFFVAAMVCHGELARTRPNARHLTEFFLLMSVGGVAGGSFNALIAPVVFSTLIEYPLVMFLVCLLRPAPSEAGGRREKRLDFALPVVMAIAAPALLAVGKLFADSHPPLATCIVFGLPAIACFAFKDRPLRFALGFAVLLVTMAVGAPRGGGETLMVERNFFGVKRVVSKGGEYRQLYHGGTSHGVQSMKPDRRHEPLSYYHRTGPLGDVFAVRNDLGNVSRVGVIGLGTGSIAAYAKPGQHFTFFEIDPAVAAIAANPAYFTFLNDCRGDYEVVLGDGRLTLKGIPDSSLDIFVLDAFSSDSVPTHLLSQEAIALYLSKLAEDGVMAFHISNRHLRFEPMLAAVAEHNNLASLMREEKTISDEEKKSGKHPSQWLVMARNGKSIEKLVAEYSWREPEKIEGTPIWTDRYCDVLSLCRK